jgi:broad specificity phosphatase PhoE
MILLLRHGQTEFNREGRWQGHMDSPLTKLGVRQAQAMGRLVRELVGSEAGWRIVSSPLGRAQRTAILVGEPSGLRDVETDPRLIEITVGAWDGRLRSEAEAQAGEEWRSKKWDFSSPDGEPYESVVDRVGSWFDSLPPEPQRRIIAVSHGITGKVIRGVYAGLDRATTIYQAAPQDAVYRLQNGQIDRFDCEPVE